MANLTDADKVLRNDTGKDIVVELAKIANGLNAPDADKVAYDNTTSGLTADNVQDAIDEVEGRVDIAESSITSLETNKMDKTNPTGTGSLSLNRKANTTIGEKSVAEGYDCEASGNYSHAEGSLTRATGYNAHAEGLQTLATDTAHAEGYITEASGMGAHAEGEGTRAISKGAHAEGVGTQASGNGAHAEGRNTEASEYYSHAEGDGTLARGRAQHVSGKYNIDDGQSVYAEIIGNGTDKNNRSNARTLDWQGNEVIAGSMTAGNGFIGNLTGTASNATNAGNANTVNNLTVLTAVPANAVFTDTDELANLKDVDFTNLTDGQVIVWNATAGKFSNITLPDPMVFRGSLGTGGTITILPVDGSATIGDTYKVITDGTYAGQTAKIGDTFICLTKTLSANTWVHIPSGDEPSGTVTSVKIEATSPIVVDNDSAITTSGVRKLSHADSGATAGSYGDSTAQTPAYGATFKVPYITVDAKGHITGINEHTVKIPDSDNTTYTLGTDGDAVTLTPSNGTAQTITVPYAEKTEEFAESTRTIGNKIPYNFRPTNGGYVSDIGDRETDKLIGGTVAWNQIEKTDASTATVGSITFTNLGNGKVRITGTFNGTRSYKYMDTVNEVPARPDDVILFSYSGDTLPSGCELFLSYFNGSTWLGGKVLTSTEKSVMKKLPANTTKIVHSGFDVSVNVPTGTVLDYTVSVNTFNLTQMFGSSVANYIYSLEQGNTGAGVAYFRKLFPKPYYAYNSGELMSVKTSAHVMTGFNQWDGTSDDGKGVNASTGYLYADSSLFATKFIKTIGGARYYANPTNWKPWVVFYDENKNYLSYIGILSDGLFTVPKAANFLKLTGFLSQKATACFNLSWDGERDGEYEPYEVNTYPLDSDLELRGIPKLDANNNLYYDGDTYESDGNVNRRYGIVDLGSLTWVANTTSTSNKYRMKALVTGLKPASTVIEIPNLRCIPYVTVSGVDTYNLIKGITASHTEGALFVYDSNYDTSESANAFKTAMSGVYLVYPLATSTTETADAYQNPQIVNDFGTEEYVDTRAVAIPVGHETEYFHYNDREKLDSLPDSANADGIYVVNQTQGKMELNTLLAGLGITLTQASNGITISAIPAYKDITGILTAGSTSITLSDNAITTSSTFDIYVDDGTNTDPCIQPTSKTVASGSITLTFLAQASDITVKVRVS